MDPDLTEAANRACMCEADVTNTQWAEAFAPSSLAVNFAFSNVFVAAGSMSIRLGPNPDWRASVKAAPPCPLSLRLRAPSLCLCGFFAKVWL